MMGEGDSYRISENSGRRPFLRNISILIQKTKVSSGKLRMSRSYGPKMLRNPRANENVKTSEYEM